MTQHSHVAFFFVVNLYLNMDVKENLQMVFSVDDLGKKLKSSKTI